MAQLHRLYESRTLRCRNNASHGMSWFQAVRLKAQRFGYEESRSRGHDHDDELIVGSLTRRRSRHFEKSGCCGCTHICGRVKSKRTCMSDSGETGKEAVGYEQKIKKACGSECLCCLLGMSC
jgi:hypothetical protein